jgi:hypothetical protein
LRSFPHCKSPSCRGRRAPRLCLPSWAAQPGLSDPSQQTRFMMTSSSLPKPHRGKRNDASSFTACGSATRPTRPTGAAATFRARQPCRIAGTAVLKRESPSWSSCSGTIGSQFPENPPPPPGKAADIEAREVSFRNRGAIGASAFMNLSRRRDAFRPERAIISSGRRPRVHRTALPVLEG